MNARILTGVFAATVAAAIAATFTTPSAEAAAGRARLDFQQGDMSVVIVGNGRDAANYFVDYTLSNPTDEARTPRLYLELRTDTNKAYGDRPSAAVVRAASKAAKGADVKSTASLRAAPIPAGQSVRGVANFGAVDPNADDLTVRVYGLWDPVIRTRNGKVLRENRVLVLKYARRGDEYDRPMDPISFVSRKEEVEGEPVELYSTRQQK